jgi:hypothetical protein
MKMKLWTALCLLTALAGCASVPPNGGLGKDAGNFAALTRGRTVLFESNFADDSALLFDRWNGGSIEKGADSAYIVGVNVDEPRSAVGRWAKLSRGSAAFLRFRLVDATPFTIKVEKHGYKEKNFNLIGLDFYNGSSLSVFEMHGENPEWTTQKWDNEGYAIGKEYGLLVDIDKQGILSFTLATDRGKPMRFAYGAALADEPWSFDIALAKGRIAVSDYQELR